MPLSLIFSSSDQNVKLLLSLFPSLHSPACLLALHLDPPSLLLFLFIYLISSPKRLCKFRASVKMRNNVIRDFLHAASVLEIQIYAHKGRGSLSERGKQKPQRCAIKHKWGQSFHRGWHGSSNQGSRKPSPHPSCLRSESDLSPPRQQYQWQKDGGTLLISTQPLVRPKDSVCAPFFTIWNVRTG